MLILMRKRHSKPSQCRKPMSSASWGDFAQLDRLLREKPNVATVALEGIVLFSNNATRDCLNGKSEEDRGRIFEAARQLAPSFRSAFKKRRAEIWSYQQQVLAEKQKKLEEKRQEVIAEKGELSRNLGELGFWSTTEAMGAGLHKCQTVTSKKAALKSQDSFWFRKVVLEQSHENKVLFQWSTQGKQFTWEQLKDHLLKPIVSRSSFENRPTNPLTESDRTSQDSTSSTPTEPRFPPPANKSSSSLQGGNERSMVGEPSRNFP